MMRRIYSCAKRTIVWLGNDEQEQGPLVRELFSAFQDAGFTCRRPNFCFTTQTDVEDMSLLGLKQFREFMDTDTEDYARMRVNGEAQWFPTDDILKYGLPAQSSNKRPAFEALLDSSYFTRIWTFQEVLSSPEAVILWGTTELS